MSSNSENSLEMTLRALLLVSLNNLETDKQVEILLRAGLPNGVIADLTGTTSNAVALRKSRLKKKGIK